MPKLYAWYQITVSLEVTRKMQNAKHSSYLEVVETKNAFVLSYTRGLLTHNGKISYSLQPKFKFKPQSQINILDFDIKA